MLKKGVFSVSQSAANPDIVLMQKNGAPFGKKEIRISDTRSYLVGPGKAQYTINAAVHIARFVATQLSLPYQPYAQLTGTDADDALIIPDEIAMGIALLQANAGVSADGIPGADFIRKVMGLHQDIVLAAHCRAALMDESNNTNATSPDGHPIVLPDFHADAPVVYDFFRSITLARNGLWCDKPGLVNFTGLRAENGDTNIQWDDTIGMCWIGPDGQKNARVYTATTEPGNRQLNKSMVPHTVFFVPGYHQGKLPAMRGHRTLAFDPTIKFPNRYVFNTDDYRGLNLHPGGDTGAMRNLVKYILPIGATNETEFRAVLVFMQIFEILTRWGLDPQRTAWANLVEQAAVKALRSGAIVNGFIPVFQDENLQPVKQISVLKARGWLAQQWSGNRNALVRILRSVDPNFLAPSNLKSLNINGLEQLITDRHIEGIVQQQCAYFLDTNSVDGLAGNTYINLLNGSTPALGAQAQQANADLKAMTDLLALFDSGHPVLTAERKNYVQQIRTQTLAERAKWKEIGGQTGQESTGQAVKELVNRWSILCQVVFGPEMYYKMMHTALGNALSSGQRRWYYTLVKEGSIPK